MTSEAELLEQICSVPDDDEPRLRYADLREKKSDRARADFIRSQIELARGKADPRRSRHLQQRVKVLLQQWRKKWAPELPGKSRIINYARGFLESVSIASNLFATEGERLLRRAPIRSLHPADVDEEDWAETARRLSESPHLEKIRHLQLDYLDLEYADLDLLFASPHARNIRSLVFGDDDSTVSMARRLSEAHLPPLTSLNFQGWMEADLGDEGLALLAGTERLSKLKELYLYNCDVKADGMKALAASPFITGLTHLDLGIGNYSLNRVGAKGAAAVAGSANFSNLEYLSLNFNNIGEDGIAALADSPHLGNLNWLTLQANDFGDEGARALAGSGILSGVGVLDLSHNRIGPDGARALVESAPKSLHSLWFYHNPVGSDGCTAIVESGILEQLTELNLCSGRIDDRGVDALLSSPHFFRLQKVLLDQNDISDGRRAEVKQLMGSRAKV